MRTLGRGAEGEVYQIVERDTGIHRAAKMYFPPTDRSHRSVVWCARKLNKLRHCSIILHYHHTQRIQIDGEAVFCIVSDVSDGQPLDVWVASKPGGRLHSYVGLTLLYHLARGIENIHAVGEYHADVHTQNILVRQRGIGFELKLIDFYNWGRPARYKQQQDVVDAIKVFHECLGHRIRYKALPPEVRYVCGGLQKSVILKRFPTISALRLHLESFEWQS